MFSAGYRMCQYTYSKCQTCFAWICLVNSRNSHVVYDCSPSKVSWDRSLTSHYIDLRFRFDFLFVITAFLMACKHISILGTVPVNHSGDDQLHSAHSHLPGLYHRPEVQY